MAPRFCSKFVSKPSDTLDVSQFKARFRCFSFDWQSQVTLVSNSPTMSRLSPWRNIGAKRSVLHTAEEYNALPSSIEVVAAEEESPPFPDPSKLHFGRHGSGSLDTDTGNAVLGRDLRRGTRTVHCNLHLQSILASVNGPSAHCAIVDQVLQVFL